MYGPPAKPSGSKDSITRGKRLADILFETRGEFNEKGRDKDFKGVLKFENSAAETKARLRLCELIADSQRHVVVGCPSSAGSLNGWAVNEMKNHPKLTTSAAQPGDAFVRPTSLVAVVLTWARYGDAGNVHDLEALMAACAKPTLSRPLDFASMRTTSRDGTYEVQRLCFSAAITARLDVMLGNKFPPCMIDGQFMSDLTSELKDKQGHLISPSEYRMDECYKEIFDRVLGGQRAIVFVEGKRGRGAFARYIMQNGGRAAPITSQFAARQDFEVDMLLELLSSGSGVICEVFIHGASTFAVLRVSVGSCVFTKSKNGIEQDLHTLLMRLYNQMLLVRLMATGQKLIKCDSTKSRLADFVTNSEAAKTFTAHLHTSHLLSKDKVYLTPCSVKGTVEGNSDAGKKRASALGTKWGTKQFTEKTGLFDPENKEAIDTGRSLGGTNGGMKQFTEKKGLWDPENEEAIDAARSLGGTNSRAPADRIFYDVRLAKMDVGPQTFTLFPTEWKTFASMRAAGVEASALGDLHGFGPFKCIVQNPGSGSSQSWATRLTKAFGAGDGTPGYVGLAGEHPVYRVQIRLATAAAAPVSEYSSSTTAVAARRQRAAKRMRAEEDEEQEDRVIGISRDEDDFLTSIGQ